jgi:hypothetical protein
MRKLNAHLAEVATPPLPRFIRPAETGVPRQNFLTQTARSMCATIRTTFQGNYFRDAVISGPISATVILLAPLNRPVDPTVDHLVRNVVSFDGFNMLSPS